MNYFDRPEMSNSRLTAWKWELERGRRNEVSHFSDKSKDIGHLFHAALFEPHLYDQILQECKSEISQKELKTLRDMQKSAMKFQTLNAFLTDTCTEFEQEFYGELCGIAFKTKVDAINKNFQAIGDAKSTSTRTLKDFLETFEKYGYWRQAYIYMMITGMPSFYFWGVSKIKPHNVFFVDVSQYPIQMANAAIEVTWLCEQYLLAEEKARKNDELQKLLIELIKGVKD